MNDKNKSIMKDKKNKKSKMMQNIKTSTMKEKGGTRWQKKIRIPRGRKNYQEHDVGNRKRWRENKKNTMR